MVSNRLFKNAHLPDELTPVLSRAEIATRVKRLARRISKDYSEKRLRLVGVLNGAFVFMADLVRGLSIPAQVDFIRLISYGSGIATSCHVRITKDIELDIKGCDVLVVEDIVDSGHTVAFLLEHLKQFDPRSVKVCAFIDKAERREVEVPIDYVGQVVESGFLVGYGLDFDGKYRGLPEICRLKQ